MKTETEDKAPDFELPDQHGNSVRLSDLTGTKNIVLYFYPKDDTPGCTIEAKAFRDNYEVFTEQGAMVIGISSDSEDSHKNFCAKYDLPFTLLSDQGGKVRKRYGVTKTLGFFPGRVTYIIDKQGIIRHIFDSQLNPQQHIDEALKILKTMNKDQL
ncbi:MAG: peroxiredoxin [Cytophagales bacterium]|nr:peroxiredoxin [Cytophagales bacterium]